MSDVVASETPVESKPGFLDELKGFWAFLPEKGTLLILMVSWCVLFQFLGNSTFGYVDTHSLFTWLLNAYNAPGSEDSHGNLIPFVVLGLIWWKRDVLLKLELKPWSPAFVLVGLGVVFHLLGFVAQQPRISVVGFLLGVYGIMGLCWGPKWMVNIFFPFFLMVFCIPIGSLAQTITFPLRILVTEIAVAVATYGLQLDIICEGTMIYDADRTFTYNVAPACSGIRSLVTLFALTTIYGFVNYQSMWRRGLMMVVSIPLAVLGNVSRITTAIVVGDVYGMKAGLAIEQKLGFLTFLIAIVGVMILGHFLTEKSTETEGNNET